MGLFDSVMVDCPKCGNQTEFQSKADDDAYCRVFTPDTAPTEILIDVLNDPHFCEKCGAWFALIDPAFPPEAPPRPKPDARLVRDPAEGEFSQHRQGMRWWDAPFSFDDLQPEEPHP